jgi:hypothetical protein
VLVLLVMALALLWLLIAAHRERLGFGHFSKRGAFVLAFLAFEVLLLGITEFSSIGHHFTAGTVVGAWSIVTFILLILARTQIRLLDNQVRSHDGVRIRRSDNAERLSNEDRFWVCIIVLIFSLLMVTGFLYTPSYADSMVYHLARVEHWIQNRSIGFFATHYLAQLEFSPLSEYNLAHLHLLSGTDRFDASMDLLSCLVCIVGVSEVARLLGGSRSTQIAAAVICASIPSAVLLATGTENDFFAAATGIGVFTILARFSFGVRWGYRAVALGAAIGLSYMAKSTMTALLLPPVLVLFVVAGIRHKRTAGLRATLGRAINHVWVIAASAFAVAGVFLVQSEQLFGSLVGPDTKALIISPITLDGMGANIVRATAADFRIGDGIAGVQSYVSMIALGTLQRFYSVFGVSINDQHYAGVLHSNTFAAGDHTLYQRIPEFGANPWDILLAVSAAVALLVAVVRGCRKLRLALVLSLTLGCGFFLLTGIGKWEPYDVRFQVPFLVAVSGVIALALSIFPRWVTSLILVGLVVSCLPQLLDNVETPLVPPHQYQGSYLTSYFGQYNHPAGSVQAAGYQTITAMLAQSTCTRAGIGNWVLYEFPLWVGLQHEHYTGVLNDFDVTNASEELEDSYRPCASITQRGPHYITPNNGTVNVQQSILALSINPSDATTIKTEAPRFHSTSHGVRVLPGAGWSTDTYGTLPFLHGSGSLYLFSDSPRRVQLQLRLVSTIHQSNLALSEPNGTSIPTITGHDTIDADLDLHRGITQVDMVTEPNAVVRQRMLVMTEVTVRSAGS